MRPPWLNAFRERKCFITLLYFIVSVFFFACPRETIADDIIIICNKDVKQSALTKADIQKIFLGRKTKWDDRKDLVFFTMKSSKLHTAFLRTYIGRSPEQYTNYWKRLLFIGKGLPPEAYDTEARLVRKVRATSGAIAYVSGKTDIKTVKRLRIED